MDRTLIKDTVEKVGEKVKICGFIQVVRAHGKIAFADLVDRSGVLQIVGREDVANLRPQYAVEIEGVVNARPDSMVNEKIETGKVEVFAESVKVLSKSAEMPFDMGMEELNLELPTLLDFRTLTLRHPKIKEIFKVQADILDGFRKSATELGCTEITVPTISASATEGGAEVFMVDYYGKKAFMTQSPQLYKQMLVPALERVFTIAHAYRAEPSVTTRHLSEATQMDCEFGFATFPELLDYLEFVGKNTLEIVSKKHNIKVNFGDKIPRLKMREAQQIIFERTGVDHRTEKDLEPEDEKEIAKWALEKYDSDLVTITHYPTKKRAFYTAPDPEDHEFSLSYDLLFRGLEILSGSLRVNNYDDLVEAIKSRGMDPKNFEMYLQAFKYGMPPEGGFSFGLERITMKLLDLKNVREASLFPRDMERVDFRFSRDVQKSENKNSVYENIIKLLDENKIYYKHYEHEPVFTSEDSAKVRGTTVHQGAKALVLDTDKGLILFVLPADLKADLDTLQTKGKFTKVKMASKDTVEAKTGLQVGCIPPFGSTIGLKTYLDSRLSDNEEIAFNVGHHDRSVKMKYSDFLNLEHPQIINF